MVFAIATLLFQFAPSVQAVPIAAATAVTTSIPEPSTLASNLPEPTADVEPNARATTKSAAAGEPDLGTTAVGEASSNGESSSVRTTSLEPTAQNIQALSTIRIPESTSEQPRVLLGVEQFPSRRSWIALSFVQHGAAAFDAYSTRYAISRGAVEADPLMRPFANSSGIYAAIQVLPVALDYTARRMQRSPNNFIRRIWWVPQSVSTASFLISGAHNLRVAGER